jgi:hypothetical protein
MVKAVQQKLNLPVASQEKSEELSGLLFEVEYFIAHLSPEGSRDAIAVEVLQLVGKLQDFRESCPSMTEEGHDLFFKLYYFFSHLEPAEFEKAALEGLDILKGVHDLTLLWVEPDAIVQTVAVPPVAAPVVAPEEKKPDALAEAVAEAVAELIAEVKPPVITQEIVVNDPEKAAEALAKAAELVSSGGVQ